MPPPLASIERSDEGSHEVVTVRGEIDVANAPLLREWLRATGDGDRDVVVDLDRVGFLAVGALYVICDEQERLAAARRRLVVVCGRQHILRLLMVCRLDDVLHVVPSRPATREPWGSPDEQRAARLRRWIERYEGRSSAP